MRKVLIHQLLISKSEVKKSFQIRLPIGIEKVEAINVTCSIGNTDQVAGSLWLRIPEERDVFYSELIHTIPHKNESLIWNNDPVLAVQPTWWFLGTQQEFFKVEVPIESTIIEGFYKDEHQQDFVKYQVNIYLQLKVNSKHSLRQSSNHK